MIKPLTIFLSIFCLFVVLLFSKELYSGTRIDLTLDPTIPVGIDLSDIDTAEMGSKIQTTTDKNGPVIANGFGLANTLGYPIGKSTLGSFPHMEMGIAAGAGCTNMKYFDDKHENGTFPMFAPNPVIHFGVGLAGGFDAIGKIFYISKSTISRFDSDQDFKSNGVELKDFMVCSTGVKLRYNYIKEKTVLPFYLSFGGLTFGLGGNVLFGDFKFEKEYKYDFNDINVDIGGTSTPVPMQFNGDFQANVHWVVFTLDFQAIAYLDIFYLFSLYSGFGVAGNIGYFRLKMTGTGDVTTTDTGNFPAGKIGRLDFSSKNSYYTTPVIPSYILGLEINLFVLKLTAETTVNMLNRKDVTAQVGTRLQF